MLRRPGAYGTGVAHVAAVAALSFILSFVVKQLGNILQLVFGWSITALFGKLSGAKAQLVTAALAKSVV